jgi:acyl-CoA reductase-like NAD-dependent aldehyde dehydrogenase
MIVKRLYVHEEIYDEFREKLVAARAQRPTSFLAPCRTGCNTTRPGSLRELVQGRSHGRPQWNPPGLGGLLHSPDHCR